MSTPETEGRIKVGITCGDVNGIGLEVIMKTFLDSRMHQLCTPVIYVGAKLVSSQRKLLNLNDFNYQTIRPGNDVILRKNNVVNIWDEETPVEWGKPTPVAGKYALRSLEAATRDLIDKKIDVLITAPINKHNIQSPEFQFKGHTDYLASKFPNTQHLMMLVSESMRIAVVTEHIPLSEASKHVTIEKIIARLKVMNQTLKRDFGIRKPKLAVLGLNPHAGDSGLIGKEEVEVIAPAVKKAFDDNIFVYGPYSADGFFGSSAFRKFDGILAMYHDQGLIPFKTLSFSSGVNFTAGLPIIRTSPDHGTAYDIAGKGIASEESFREAIFLAIDVLRKREEFDKINSNPMQIGTRHGRDN